jgi:threonyl-tRNA synthetase
LRAELASGGTLAARIREHKLVPYQAVIGKTEAAAGEVSLRLRTGERLPAMTTAEALAKITRQVQKHTPELWSS